ncbi:MAG TPA: helix-turn-helix domain-containing protein [Coleofasciculaceae cyanobacterium]|jgi:DNA-binding transcriptional ArsR family regulator
MMVGVSSVQVKESLEELAKKLRQAKTPREKERLQVLNLLKQEKAPKINAIANSLGKHRGTVQSWLSRYKKEGIESMLEIKSYPGRVRIIPGLGRKSFRKTVTRT